MTKTTSTASVSTDQKIEKTTTSDAIQSQLGDVQAVAPVMISRLESRSDWINAMMVRMDQNEMANESVLMASNPEAMAAWWAENPAFQALEESETLTFMAALGIAGDNDFNIEELLSGSKAPRSEIISIGSETVSLAVAGPTSADMMALQDILANMEPASGESSGAGRAGGSGFGSMVDPAILLGLDRLGGILSTSSGLGDSLTDRRGGVGGDDITIRSVSSIDVNKASSSDDDMVFDGSTALFGAGNVLENDQSTSGNLVLKTVTLNGVGYNVPDTGVIEIVGTMGRLSIGSNGDYIYTPLDAKDLGADISGIDLFEYTAEDAVGLVTTATLAVTVNDKIPVVGTVTATGNGNGSTTVTASGNLLSEASGGDGTLRVATIFGKAMPVSGLLTLTGEEIGLGGTIVSLTVNANGQYSLVAARGAVINSTLAFTVIDQDGDVASATFELAIENADILATVPGLAVDALSLSEDGTGRLVIRATNNDPDSERLTVTATIPTGWTVTDLAGGTLANGVWTRDLGVGENLATGPVLQPPANWNGSLTIPVSAVSTETNGGAVSNPASANAAVTVSAVNDAPTISLSGTGTVAENLAAGAAVAGVTLSASDPEGNTVRWEIVSGNTNNAFAINPTTGAITTTAVLNREAIASYDLVVRAVDSGGLASGNQTVRINVADVNEAPTISLSGTGTVAENLAAGAAVAGVTLSASDPEGNTVRWEIVSGNTNNAFAINPTTGAITTTAVLNREAIASYDLVVRAVDSGGLASGNQTVRINVADVNEAPTISLSGTGTVAENLAAGAAVAGVTLSSSDPEGNTVRWEIVSGNTNNAFAINPTTGAITTTAVLNREAIASYDLVVRAVDSGGLASGNQTVRINVADVNEAPTISLSGTGTVAENLAAGAAVAGVTLSASDPEGNTVRWEIVSGNTNNAFAINPTTGAITTTAVLNREAIASYDLVVRAVDSGGLASGNQTVRINVADVNEAPTISLSGTGTVAENLAAGAAVAGVTLSASDPEGNTVRWEIVSGNTNNAFAINPTTGAITTTAVLNREAIASYDLVVRAVDSGGLASGNQTVRINVADVNEAPTISLSGTGTVAENLAAGAAVAGVTLSSSDPEGNTVRWEIVSGNTNNAFAINPTTGAITTTAVLNREAIASYDLVVRAVDSGGLASGNQTVRINVADVNEAPTISLSGTGTVAENLAAGAAVAGVTLSSSDPEGNTVRWEIVSGNTNNAFAINPTTGAITTTAVLNREAIASYDLVVRAVDSGGLASGNQTVRINVADVNEAPTISLSGTGTVAENLAAGAAVAGVTLSASDPEGNTVRWEIVSGNTNNAFAINPTTGAITTTAVLNREAIASYDLVVRAVDSGGLASGNQTVRINVADVNEAPTISLSGTGTVAENLAAGAAVAGVTLSASDPEGNTVRWEIVSGNTNNAFAINPTTGAITTTAVLNREAIASYDLVVRAVDSGGLASGNQTVRINVADVNEAPTISLSGTGTVAENLAAGAAVAGVTLSASDPEGNTVRWEIVSGNTNNAFAINPTTGAITTTAVLNREAIASYDLVVRAVDSGGLASGNQTVRINVADVNEAPTISLSGTGTVAENLAAGAAVAGVTLSSSDPEGNTVRWEIVSGNTNNAFAINPTTGAITTTAVLNREAIASYDLVVRAVDSGGLASGNQTVRINVADVNEAPTISLSGTGTVAENLAAGAAVAGVTLSASDPEGNTVRWEIVSGNTNNAFAINPTTGAITTTAVLNREAIASYDLVVRAVDSGGLASGNQTVRINVADVNEAPTISLSGTGTVAENLAAGAAVAGVTLSASDPEGNTVRWEIVSGNTNNAFAINPTTGAITTTAVLNREAIASYDLVVRAVDSGGLASGNQTVRINVADVNEAPTISLSGTGTVAENLAAGAAVAGVTLSASDPEGNTVRWEIVSGNTNNAFAINPTTGAITTTAVLNREAIASYDLVVRAVDSGGLASGNQTVRINVADVNEAPTISLSGTGTVAENLAAGAAVAGVTLSASDPEGNTVRWEIVSGNTNNAFAINPTTGAITTTAVLNREAIASYDLVVRAVDSGGLASGNQTVRINVADVNEAPTISLSGTGTVAENLAAGAAVAGVTLSASDPEGNTVRWEIVSGNTNNAFAINPTTGAITTTAVLNREAIASYDLVVRAVDSGGLASGNQTVRINVADVNEAPTISLSGTGTVAENLAAGAAVAGVTLSASDPEGNTVRWEIVSGNTNNAFAINPTTGAITTTAVLNREAIASYDLVVRAVDSGGLASGNQTVRINVADVNEAPTISLSGTGTVAENLAAGAAVAGVTLSASDPEGNTVRWEIVSGNTNNAFAINPTTGAITTTAVLNREAIASYDLVVRAVDSGGLASGNQTVRINVADVNEAPTISLSGTGTVAENLAAGAAVAGVTLSASDPEGNTVRWEIVSGNTNNAFAINPTTGAITTTAVLNREAIASYDLVVRAVDSGGLASGNQTVRINVADVNEAPTISLSGTGTVAENLAAGAAVAGVTLSASDPEGNTVRWEIVSGNTNNAFAINPTTGAITTTAVLNREAIASYDLVVRAVDSGGLASGNQTVRINVADVNEAPTISLSGTGTVAENLAAGAAVAGVTLSASDPEGNTVRWEIVSGNTNNAFAINPTTGAITTTAVLNREAIASYDLVVRAVDSGGLASGNQTVRINVADVNEAPTISLSGTGTVAENLAAGAAVAGVTLSASDPEGNTVRWEIVSGNTNNAFAINPTTGAITTTAVLNREAIASYDLVVRAVDSGGLASGNQTVRINVADVNEAPTISLSGTGTVAENLAAGAAVAGVTLSASDPEGNTVRWEIVSGNTNNAFAINPTTGAITTTAVLNREAIASYDLVVRAVDSGGLASGNQTVRINVADVNEAPIINKYQYPSIYENSVIGTNTYFPFSLETKLGAVDPDGDSLTWSMIDGAGAFKISSDGQLSTISNVDYETQRSYFITVRATDTGGLSADQTIEVGIRNVNDPTIINSTSFSVSEENWSNGGAYQFGQISVSDQDSSVTLSMIDKSGKFSLSSSGEIFVTGDLDYEVQNEYDVIIRAEDTTGNVTDKIIRINVTDVNENPVILSDVFYVTKGTQSGTIIGNLLGYDPEDEILSWSIRAGSYRPISISSSGEILSTQVINWGFDDLVVQVQDPEGLITWKSIEIKVIEPPATVPNNLDPTDIINTYHVNGEWRGVGNNSNNIIGENEAHGTAITTLSSFDPNGDNLTWSIIGGTGQGLFTIDQNGIIYTNQVFDYESIPSSFPAEKNYTLTAQVSDGHGGTKSIDLVIDVLNRPEAPTITSTAFSVNEDVAPGNLVARLTFSDPENDVTSWTIIGGSDKFSINNSGEIYLTSALDYETQNAYDLVIKATDSRVLSDQKIIHVTVNDVNEAPIITSANNITINENINVGTAVGSPLAATDPDGGAVIWSMVDGAGKFSISRTGQITTTGLIDFESKNAYDIVVRATDVGGMNTDKKIRVTIDDVKITEIAGLSTEIVNENLPVNTSVVQLSAINPGSDIITWSIVGGTGADLFSIDNTGLVQTTRSFDYESMATANFTLKVQVSNGYGDTLTKDLSINIGNVNEAPTITSIMRDVNENVAIGTSLGALSATDPEGNQITWSMVDGAGKFALASDGTLTTTGAIDYETKNAYDIVVRATDTGGLKTDQTIRIYVKDINETNLITITQSNIPSWTNVSALDQNGMPVAVFNETASFLGVHGGKTALIDYNKDTGKSETLIFDFAGHAAESATVQPTFFWALDPYLFTSGDSIYPDSISKGIERGHWKAFYQGILVGEADFSANQYQNADAFNIYVGTKFDRLEFTALSIVNPTGTPDDNSDYGIAAITLYNVDNLVPPLVLDLNRDDQINLISIDQGVTFDMTNDGILDRTGWVSAGDGQLAVDLNGNGIIDNQNELFGSPMGSPLELNGFTELGSYDENSDGKVSSMDSIWSKLIVWQDVNQDGISQSGEMKLITEYEIASIDTAATRVDQTVAGNKVYWDGNITMNDGSSMDIVDAYYQVVDGATPTAGSDRSEDTSIIASTIIADPSSIDAAISATLVDQLSASETSDIDAAIHEFLIATGNENLMAAPAAPVETSPYRDVVILPPETLPYDDR